MSVLVTSSMGCPEACDIQRTTARAEYWVTSLNNPSGVVERFYPASSLLSARVTKSEVVPCRRLGGLQHVSCTVVHELRDHMMRCRTLKLLDVHLLVEVKVEKPQAPG